MAPLNDTSAGPGMAGGPIRRRIDAVGRLLERIRRRYRLLKSGEALYRAIVENATEGIVVAQDERIKFYNSMAREILGDNPESRSFASHIHPDDREMVLRRHAQRLAGKDIPTVYPFRILKNGATRWVEINSVMIIWEKRPASLNLITDITERKAAETALENSRDRLEDRVRRRTAELVAANRKLQDQIAERERAEAALRRSEEKYRTILREIAEGYFEVDLSGRITFFNNAMCRISDCPPDRLMGMHNTEYTTPETARRMYEVFNRVYQTGKPEQVMDYEIIRGDGRRRILEVSTALIRDAGRTPVGFRGIARDVTERKRAEAELAYLAYHDSLTGLWNRKAFMEKLDHSIRYAERYNMRRAVLFIDLDRFKQVNDTLGHETGDALLREAARRLTETLRRTDIICRLGGDEFTVILNNPERLNPETAGRNIREAISRPYDIGGTVIDYVTPSIGVSRFPEDGRDVETLIRNADTAMYHAKASRNCCALYSEAAGPAEAGRRL